MLPLSFPLVFCTVWWTDSNVRELDPFRLLGALRLDVARDETVRFHDLLERYLCEVVERVDVLLDETFDS